MSTTLLSAMTAALLTAACVTALADSSRQQNPISTVGEPGILQASTSLTPAADDASGYIQAVGRNASHSMHPDAPLAGEQFADDDAFGYIQAGGRNGSHSMHPNAPVTAEQYADEDVKVLQQTGDQ